MGQNSPHTATVLEEDNGHQYGHTEGTKGEGMYLFQGLFFEIHAWIKAETKDIIWV